MIQYSQTPAEQFRDLIPTFRNAHIVALLQPLVLLHQQIHSNGGLADRSGSNTAFRNLILKHVYRADQVRARVTWNPANSQLSALTIPEVEAALKAELARTQTLDNLTQGVNPVTGDTVVSTTTQLIDVPWKFDGSDDSGTIRLNSQLEERFKSGPGYIVFGAVNEAIVACTTNESRHNAKFLSTWDSERIMSQFEQIVTLAMTFMGEEMRLDVPEAVLANERPGGPNTSPNVKGEASGNPGTSN